MFKTLRFLFVAALIAASIVWLLDNNGSIIVKWLGYEVRTDILTTLLLVIIFTATIFFLAYFSAKVLSVKIPQLIQFLNRKKNDQ